jgi:hypothetical protein
MGRWGDKLDHLGSRRKVIEASKPVRFLGNVGTSKYVAAAR